MKNTKSALALLVALALAGCAVQPKSTATAQPAAAAPVPAAQANNVQQRELTEGLYEMALSPAAGALYVASAQGFKDSQGGVVYKLDPATLKTLSVIHTDLKNFGVTSDPQGDTLFITNSVDGGVTALDTATGKVKGRLMFSERNDKGRPYGPREIIWHDGLLYIGAVADPGQIWVVDANQLKLKSRIKNAGKWVTGLLYSEQTKRLYAANGSGEILVINPRSQRIEARWKPLGDKETLWLNLAEDPETGRLFVTDNSKAKTTLVLDIHTGSLVKQLDIGDSLAVKFNPQRHEIYVTQRDSGKVLSLDASTYQVKQQWNLPTHPNSLLLSADGQTLYVTVKAGRNKDRTPQGLDSIVRIALN